MVDGAVAALVSLGLGPAAAQSWVEVLAVQTVADGTAPEGVPSAQSAQEVLGGVGAMARARCTLDASVLVATQELLLRTGELLLNRAGARDPSTMTVTARRSWRAEVKAAVAAELQLTLGVGVGEARQLVGIASYPAAIRLPILGALRRGEVSWHLVRRFQERSRRLDVPDAAAVSGAMFGTDPHLAAPERLDADDQLVLGRPWFSSEYLPALDRQITLVTSTHDDAQEQEREAARASRDVRLEVDDNTMATITWSGSLSTALAMYGRIDAAARRARHGGDPRTLANLRSDILGVLGLHGRVWLPGDAQPGDPAEEPHDTQQDDTQPDNTQPAETQPAETQPDNTRADNTRAATTWARAQRADGHGTQPAFDEIVTPADAEALTSFINATPPGQVELVVPWDAVVGAVCPQCHGQMVTPDPPAVTRIDTTGDGSPSPATRPTTDPGPGTDREPPAPRTDLRDQQRNASPSSGSGLAPPGRVGELVGWTSGFITPAQARTIVLTPGTVLSRLLVDPADGRCIERTIDSYAPDAQMRRQVRAADRFGRGPGSRQPARTCEIDHEHERHDGGPTTETNLNCKARADHYRKTKGLWRSVMNARRDVTWTTLLGQVATTRGHDYRQYSERVAQLAPYDPADSHHRGTHVEDRADLSHRRDLVNQVLYAALVHRDAGGRAEAPDDVVGSEDWLMLSAAAAHLRHIDQHGRRRHGPDPDHPTPEQLLDLQGSARETTDPPNDDCQAATVQPDDSPGPRRRHGASDPPPF